MNIKELLESGHNVTLNVTPCGLERVCTGDSRRG